jgi:enamine deaminase RidA (YjgF/YER057c/UK114 family)
MALSPKTLSALVALSGTLSRTLEVATIESMGMAVPQGSGCEYCLQNGAIDFHHTIGRTNMSNIDRRLGELGIILPRPWALPSGVVVPASLIRVRGKRVVISGHVPTNPDGSVAEPLGRVGGEVSPAQAYEAARRALASILASLKAKIGDLDQIVAWVRICGMFVPANGFTGFPQALNGASDLLQEVFGPEVGDHARLAIGVAALPFDAPLEIEGEVELA